MAAKYPILDPADLDQFLRARPYSVIHLDASWNGQRISVQEQINNLIAKVDDTSFGFIDVDVHQDHARSIPILNVPACCYYCGPKLVLTITGMQQDIGYNLQVLRDGGHPPGPGWGQPSSS